MLAKMNTEIDIVKILLISLLNCHVNDYVTTFLRVFLSKQPFYLTRILTYFSRNDQYDLRWTNSRLFSLLLSSRTKIGSYANLGMILAVKK